MILKPESSGPNAEQSGVHISPTQPALIMGECLIILFKKTLSDHYYYINLSRRYLFCIV